MASVTPPRADLFKPPPDRVYTNGEVNRAGKLMRQFYFEPRGGGAPWDGPWEDRKDEVVNAMYAITWWKQRHARPLSAVATALRYHVGQEDGYIDDKVDVTQRLKKRDTIIDKLERFPHMALTQMHDIGGVRARLPSLECLINVSRRLKKNWTIAKARDYIERPKDSGYRAIHLDVRHRSGRTIEVQLRTFRQDAWANQVEDDGRRLGTGYKFGFGADDIHAYFRAISEVFWCLDSEQEITDDLAKELQARYAKIRGVLRPTSSGGKK